MPRYKEVTVSETVQVRSYEPVRIEVTLAPDIMEESEELTDIVAELHTEISAAFQYVYGVER